MSEPLAMAELLAAAAGTVPDADKTVLTYTYDTAGNRATLKSESNVIKNGTRTVTSYTTTYTYDSNNRLTKESKQPSSGSAVATTYTYDANGNQTQKAIGTQTETYAYDVFNRLTNSVVDSTTAYYSYLHLQASIYMV